MKPSRILLVSIFITAVILAVIGGVTTIAMANKPNSADQSIEAYQQREAEYQQLIQQANQQLEQANQKLQEIQAQSSQGQGVQAQQAPSTTTSLAISADKAEQIARQVADPTQSLQTKAELVDYEGKTAYNLAFQNGSIYIDAQTGDILFNGTIPQEINAEKAVAIASDYLKNKDVLQVDQITFRGAPLFRVIFKNGVMVYLDMTGQITYMLKSSPKVVLVQQPSSGSGGGGGGGDQHHDDNGGRDD